MTLSHKGNLATAYVLLRITDAGDWRAYHTIRRLSLWEERGLSGYDDARPEERFPGRHSLLLKFEGDALGTTRLDEEGNGVGIVRLVAIRRPERGKGHGRALSNLVDDYARNLGIQTLFVSAAREAEGFYAATGWAPSIQASGETQGTDVNFVTMTKTIDRMQEEQTLKATVPPGGRHRYSTRTQPCGISRSCGRKRAL